MTGFKGFLGPARIADGRFGVMYNHSITLGLHECNELNKKQKR